MGLEWLECKLDDIFEEGQGYVALSRAIKLNGLRVTAFDPKRFRVSSSVITFYDRHIKGRTRPENTAEESWAVAPNWHPDFEKYAADARASDPALLRRKKAEERSARADMPGGSHKRGFLLQDDSDGWISRPNKVFALGRENRSKSRPSSFPSLPDRKGDASAPLSRRHADPQSQTAIAAAADAMPPAQRSKARTSKASSLPPPLYRPSYLPPQTSLSHPHRQGPSPPQPPPPFPIPPYRPNRPSQAPAQAPCPTSTITHLSSSDDPTSLPVSRNTHTSPLKSLPSTEITPTIPSSSARYPRPVSHTRNSHAIQADNSKQNSSAHTTRDSSVCNSKPPSPTHHTQTVPAHHPEPPFPADTRHTRSANCPRPMAPTHHTHARRGSLVVQHQRYLPRTNTRMPFPPEAQQRPAPSPAQATRAVHVTPPAHHPTPLPPAHSTHITSAPPVMSAPPTRQSRVPSYTHTTLTKHFPPAQHPTHLRTTSRPHMTSPTLAQHARSRTPPPHSQNTPSTTTSPAYNAESTSTHQHP